MISFLFFTKDEGNALARSLAPLVHDAVEGHVAEVIIYDSRSSDVTDEVADGAGCNLYQSDEIALRHVVDRARGDWLVVMEPGARLEPGWHDAVFDHMMEPGAGPARFRPEHAVPFWKRLKSVFGKPRPLQHGLIVSKRAVMEKLGGDVRDAGALTRLFSPKPIAAWIEPAARKG